MKGGLLLVAGILAAGLLSGGCRSPARSPAAASDDPAVVRRGPVAHDSVGPLRASGVFQTDEVLVRAETAGTVRWVGVEEGDEVMQGDVLAQIDTALIDGQIQQAQAALQTARAQLLKVKAGARPEEIAAADAAVKRAVEDTKSAEAAVEVARGMVPSALAVLQGAQADLARLRAGASTQDIASALERAKTAEDRLSPLGKMRDATGGQEQSGAMPAGSYDAAQAAVALADLNATITRLQAQNVQAGAKAQDIQAAQAEVEAAQAAVSAARLRVTESERHLEGVRARLRQAQAQAELVGAGASAEQIALAKAPVRSAEAALRVLEIRRKQASLIAPGSGVVVERNVSLGEQVLPGTVLFRLGDVTGLELKVFVPGVRIGQVRLGQRVEITVGAHPDQKIDGDVNYISSQAEFSPAAMTSGWVASSEVFAVRIRIANPGRVLKPGMPAEAVFVE
jgi:multidrug efflux pump subunit AcrA (membrane-fusion protein)